MAKRSGRCPVCNVVRKVLMQVVHGTEPVLMSAFMYQRSYPGEREYVSPRCEVCYEKVVV